MSVLISQNKVVCRKGHLTVIFSTSAGDTVKFAEDLERPKLLTLTG